MNEDELRRPPWFPRGIVDAENEIAYIDKYSSGIDALDLRQGTTLWATGTVYVTFGGHLRGNIWKTEDGGQTWTNVDSLLPEAPIRAVTIHPRKNDFIYLGTEVGIFASEDGGAAWSPTNEGPTNGSVNHLFWMGETLVCATHGRSMFQIDLSQV